MQNKLWDDFPQVDKNAQVITRQFPKLTTFELYFPKMTFFPERIFPDLTDLIFGQNNKKKKNDRKYVKNILPYVGSLTCIL